MKINPNLLLSYSHHSNIAYTPNSATSAVAPIEKGKTYMVSYTVTNTNRFSLWQDTMDNGLNADRVDTTDDLFNRTEIGDKIKRTFKADLDGYVVIYLNNLRNNAREPDLKIEEGNKVTHYIPSKYALNPSKQAIFVSGGVFQDIYPK